MFLLLHHLKLEERLTGDNNLEIIHVHLSYNKSIAWSRFYSFHKAICTFVTNALGRDPPGLCVLSLYICR